MGIQEFTTHEEMDNAFEAEMDRLEGIERLKEEIIQAEAAVGWKCEELIDVEGELQALRDQLEELEI